MMKTNKHYDLDSWATPFIVCCYSCHCGSLSDDDIMMVLDLEQL